MADSMNISTETLNAFKKLYEIDQSLIVDCEQVETVEDDEGNEKQVTVLRTKSHNKTMMARVTINETFPRNINIYDLREFISVINIVKEPEFDLSDDKFVMIKSSDDRQKLRYLEANPDLITSYIAKDLQLSSNDAEIEVSASQFDSVLVAAHTMKLEYVGFIADGSNLSISAFNKNNGDEQYTNNFSSQIEETESEFRMFYRLDVHNLQVLKGEGDLKFIVDGKRKVSRVETESGKVLWIAFDNGSKYNS